MPTQEFLMANRIAVAGREVKLYAQFYDTAGNPTNADQTPTVAIYDSNGTLKQSATNVGITLEHDPGLYSFSWIVPFSFSDSDAYGIDTWSAKIGNETITASFEFLVLKAGSIEESDKPKPYPGDDYTFDFTEEEVEGVNKLLKVLKRRLKSSGTRKVPDGAGGYMEVECPVFSDDELICFLINGLSEFNQTPHVSNFTFAHQQIQDIYLDIVVQGAALVGMSAQALIERGREFTMTDSGVSFSPPAISEILNTQYSAQLSDYRAKLIAIKTSIKPHPRGLGTVRLTSVAPAYTRLRHLRERGVI